MKTPTPKRLKSGKFEDTSYFEEKLEDYQFFVDGIYEECGLCGDDETLNQLLQHLRECAIKVEAGLNRMYSVKLQSAGCILKRIEN